MGRLHRRQRVPAAARARLGGAARRPGRALRLHLDRVGLRRRSRRRNGRDDAACSPLPSTRPTPPDAELYGARKVACEQEVERAFPGRTLIIRPGIVAGPARPDEPLHLVGRAPRARGRGARAGLAGCARPARGRTRPGRVHRRPDRAAGDGRLQRLRAAVVLRRADRRLPHRDGLEPEVTWVSEQLLLEHGRRAVHGDAAVAARRAGEPRVLLAVERPRARSQGLELRHLADTARDTWEWLRAVRAGELPEPIAGGFVARGLSPSARQRCSPPSAD